jgi:AcrR family transcriptional regulator
MRPRGRGRPRAFDREAALAQATGLFWTQGLCGDVDCRPHEAMAIGAPSLYAAFGSKEALYVEALGHYAENYEALVWARFRAAGTAREAVAGLSPGFGRSPDREPRRYSLGCMVTLSSVGGEGHAELGERMRAARARHARTAGGPAGPGRAEGELPAAPISTRSPASPRRFRTACRSWPATGPAARNWKAWRGSRCSAGMPAWPRPPAEPLFTTASFAARSAHDAFRRDQNYYPQNDPLRWGGGYARDLSGILEPAPPNGAGPALYLKPGRHPRLPIDWRRPNGPTSHELQAFSRSNPPRVGVVGATGLVGEHDARAAGRAEVPLASLRLFASARSAGTTFAFKGQDDCRRGRSTADFAGLDIVFFSAGGDTSRELAPKAAAAGAVVIDNSSAWRDGPGRPAGGGRGQPARAELIPKGIVANPNCTTMAAMPVLKPLHDSGRA